MTDDPTRDEVTRLLADSDLNAGERANRLLPHVYSQLRAAAQQCMAGERADHTLNATALVHEAYVRLIGDRKIPWQNRKHFYVAAAEAMRRVLLDHAKARGRIKRGGGRARVPLSVADVAETWDYDETVSLDDAIGRLTEQDDALGSVVKLRFYAGLSIEQTATALDTSKSTVKRQWELARTWLFRELQRTTDDD